VIERVKPDSIPTPDDNNIMLYRSAWERPTRGLGAPDGLSLLHAGWRYR